MIRSHSNNIKYFISTLEVYGKTSHKLINIFGKAVYLSDEGELLYPLYNIHSTSQESYITYPVLKHFSYLIDRYSKQTQTSLHTDTKMSKGALI